MGFTWYHFDQQYIRCKHFQGLETEPSHILFLPSLLSFFSFDPPVLCYYFSMHNYSITFFCIFKGSLSVLTYVSCIYVSFFFSHWLFFFLLSGFETFKFVCVCFILFYLYYFLVVSFLKIGKTCKSHAKECSEEPGGAGWEETNQRTRMSRWGKK